MAFSAIIKTTTKRWHYKNNKQRTQQTMMGEMPHEKGQAMRMKRRDFLKGLGMFSALLLAGGGALAEGMRTDMHDETSMETIGADGFGKMLIDYYSLTGHTRAAAQKIQELTGADLMEIHPKDPYPVSHDPCLKRQMQEIETDARWMEGLRVRGDVKEIQTWLQQAARKERA